jgi:hypothetical protein
MILGIIETQKIVVFGRAGNIRQSLCTNSKIHEVTVDIGDRATG